MTETVSHILPNSHLPVGGNKGMHAIQLWPRATRQCKLYSSLWYQRETSRPKKALCSRPFHATSLWLHVHVWPEGCSISECS